MLTRYRRRDSDDVNARSAGPPFQSHATSYPRPISVPGAIATARQRHHNQSRGDCRLELAILSAHAGVHFSYDHEVSGQRLQPTIAPQQSLPQLDQRCRPDRSRSLRKRTATTHAFLLSGATTSPLTTRSARNPNPVLFPAPSPSSINNQGEIARTSTGQGVTDPSCLAKPLQRRQGRCCRANSIGPECPRVLQDHIQMPDVPTSTSPGLSPHAAGLPGHSPASIRSTTPH